MTFYVFSLGCKVNSYESRAVSQQLISLGYKEVSYKEKADIVIINTCSVTATADQKSRQHIRKFMKKYPDAITVVMGCYSQGNYEFLDKNIKPAIILGTDYRNEIPQLIEEYIKTKKRIVKINSNRLTFSYSEFGVISYNENVRAYLKIQDGCDNFCTYCIVPYRRGKMRSREFDEVINEAKYLIKLGYKEIVLTGIHVGGYGKDLGNVSFSDLVDTLTSLEGLESLRISSIEESEIDEKLINLYKTRKNLAPHIHIPLQSGSTSVLKRMNRKYTADEFLNKLNSLRKSLPNVAITSDVIVGFPGETEEEFKETYDLIVKSDINMLHVFPYSVREGTVAAKMENQIAPQVKKERANVLLELSKEQWRKYCCNYIGKPIEVLIEQYDEKSGYFIGHTRNYIEVKTASLDASIGEYITITILQNTDIIN